MLVVEQEAHGGIQAPVESSAPDFLVAAPDSVGGGGVPMSAGVIVGGDVGAVDDDVLVSALAAEALLLAIAIPSSIVPEIR